MSGPVTKITNAKMPVEGPKSINLYASFQAGAALTQTLQITLYDAGITGVQSAILDNSQSSYPTLFYFPGSGQNIQVPALTQQIVPLVCATPTFTAQIVIPVSQTIQVGLVLTNVPLPVSSWQTSSIGPLTFSLFTLTSGFSWTVPTNWNNSNNICLAWGAGGNGAGGATGNNTSSGGGGAFAFASNLSFTPGALVPYQIGLGGGSYGTGVSPTANTWLKDGSTLLAQGGQNGISGGAAGLAANCFPTGGAFSGGQGQSTNYGYPASGCSGSGGGGAAGPNGAGAAGVAGAIALTVGSAGGQGDNGTGGNGGPGGNVSGGYAGNAGSETYGGFGGGGGGGGGASNGPTGKSYPGGAGGQFGAGGAGQGCGLLVSSFSTGGAGAGGGILIGYFHN
jgi:hypothetical protein